MNIDSLRYHIDGSSLPIGVTISFPRCESHFVPKSVHSFTANLFQPLSRISWVSGIQKIQEDRSLARSGCSKYVLNKSRQSASGCYHCSSSFVCVFLVAETKCISTVTVELGGTERGKFWCEHELSAQNVIMCRYGI